MGPLPRSGAIRGWLVGATLWAVPALGVASFVWELHRCRPDYWPPDVLEPGCPHWHDAADHLFDNLLPVVFFSFACAFAVVIQVQRARYREAMAMNGVLAEPDPETQLYRMYR